MENYIVTSGELFTDIDAYACAIAYAELLRLEGKNAEVVLPGVLNNSITPTVRSWNITYSLRPSFKEYKSIIVDVSEPAHVAKCAIPDSILEVYDHRHGFEDIWREKLGKDSHIEKVGACTTLIWEEFKKRGFSNKISKYSANLLLIGTVSNTLDFKAQVTTPRDKDASIELQKYSDLPLNWKETYFEEQNESMLKDPVNAIKMDTKILQIPGLGFSITMGQMELWDSKHFIKNHTNDIRSALEDFGTEDWFMSAPSISEGKNYFYCESERTKALLRRIFLAEFKGNFGETDILWLRKEIRKKLLESFK
jgi:inorganic pyrophosphatase/exopolyphosphatase